MLTVGYSIKEFLDSVTLVKWEWILAAIILIGTSLGSRLESRSHVTWNKQHETRNPKRVTRNT